MKDITNPKNKFLLSLTVLKESFLFLKNPAYEQTSCLTLSPNSCSGRRFGSTVVSCQIKSDVTGEVSCD